MQKNKLLALLFSMVLNTLFYTPPSLASNAGSTADGSASKATFDGKIMLNNVSSTKAAFDATDKLDIAFEVAVAPEHIGKPGFMYVAVVYNGEWYWKDANGEWHLWDKIPEHMLANRQTSSLKANETILVQKELSLLMGNFKAYVAYRVGGEVHLNASPLDFNVIVVPECP